MRTTNSAEEARHERVSAKMLALWNATKVSILTRDICMPTFHWLSIRIFRLGCRFASKTREGARLRTSPIQMRRNTAALHPSREIAEAAGMVPLGERHECLASRLGTRGSGSNNSMAAARVGVECFLNASQSVLDGRTRLFYSARAASHTKSKKPCICVSACW